MTSKDSEDGLEGGPADHSAGRAMIVTEVRRVEHEIRRQQGILSGLQLALDIIDGKST